MLRRLDERDVQGIAVTSSLSDSKSSSPILSGLMVKFSKFEAEFERWEKRCLKVQGFFDSNFKFFAGWQGASRFEDSGVLKAIATVKEEGLRFVERGRHLLEQLSVLILECFREWEYVSHTLIHAGGLVFAMARIEVCYDDAQEEIRKNCLRTERR